MSPLLLVITRDKTTVYNLTVTEADGITPQNLTGMTLYFHAALIGTSFEFTKSSPSTGITITNATAGLATLQINPADTTQLGEECYDLACELTMVDGSGNAYELNRGCLTVQPNVGTP